MLKQNMIQLQIVIILNCILIVNVGYVNLNKLYYLFINKKNRLKNRIECCTN